MIPRIRFAYLPTPIEPMPQLEKALNGPHLLVRKDRDGPDPTVIHPHSEGAFLSGKPYIRDQVGQRNDRNPSDTDRVVSRKSRTRNDPREDRVGDNRHFHVPQIG